MKGNVTDTVIRHGIMVYFCCKDSLWPTCLSPPYYHQSSLFTVFIINIHNLLNDCTQKRPKIQGCCKIHMIGKHYFRLRLFPARLCAKLSGHYGLYYSYNRTQFICTRCDYETNKCVYFTVNLKAVQYKVHSKFFILSIQDECIIRDI